MENTDNKQSMKGPIFETGPGWGQRLRDLVGGSFILPAVSLLVFMIGLSMFVSSRNANQATGNSQSRSPMPAVSVVTDTGIEVSVVRGDSQTTIARRAITAYLQTRSNSLPQITPGMRVYAEEQLKISLKNTPLVIGSTISVRISDVEAALAKARALTAEQLKKWEFYGNRIRF